MSSSLDLENLLPFFPDFPVRYIAPLQSYLDGEEYVLSPEEFEDVTSSCTPFTRLVLRELLNLPKGRLVTYMELARRLGRPHSVRAVASALGRNPLPVLIPCHRVIAARGIGGYAFGVELKKRLIEHEKTLISTPFLR